MKNYIGKSCWQTHCYKYIYFGKITDQKMENKWLLVLVEWDSGNSTWERVVNVSFKSLHFDPKKGDQLRSPG